MEPWLFMVEKNKTKVPHSEVNFLQTLPHNFKQALASMNSWLFPLNRVSQSISHSLHIQLRSTSGYSALINDQTIIESEY